MTGSESHLQIRLAEPGDVPTILSLIRELAVFEDLLDEVKISEEDLLRDGFGEPRYFECLLAELSGEAVSYALFFTNYSTFEGRPGIYLEDIYVSERARGAGVGKRMIRHLATIAIEREFKRLDLSVLHWNPARAFYDKLGFAHLSDWLPYRVDGDRLAALAIAD